MRWLSAHPAVDCRDLACGQPAACLLIPSLGMNGAAIATSISYSAAMSLILRFRRVTCIRRGRCCWTATTCATIPLSAPCPGEARPLGGQPVRGEPQKERESGARPACPGLPQPALSAAEGAQPKGAESRVGSQADLPAGDAGALRRDWRFAVLGRRLAALLDGDGWQVRYLETRGWRPDRRWRCWGSTHGRVALSGRRTDPAVQPPAPARLVARRPLAMHWAERRALRATRIVAGRATASLVRGVTHYGAPWLAENWRRWGDGALAAT
jgi:hypothetical protein